MTAVTSSKAGSVARYSGGRYGSTPTPPWVFCAQANGHIAELKVQIVRQRVIVKYTLDTRQPSEMAESMLHALEESLSAFEKHRELVLDRLKR